MDTIANETVQYFFVVRGFAPELMRGVAFRRAKHYDTRGKKTLKCPHCRGIFETVDSTVKVELYHNPRNKNVSYHASISCRLCHNKVGIIYASA